VKRAAILEHAADLLDAEARGIRRSRTVFGIRMSHTYSGNGDFIADPEAKAVHDDFQTTAAGLRAVAQKMRDEAAAKLEKTHA
jgi:hypothetical protein